MVKALNIKYLPSESVVAQGKDVAKRLNEGFYKQKGGNGSYRMSKPTSVTLEIDVDGQRHSCPAKELIKKAYSLSRISEARANQFLADVQSGKFNLNYSDAQGLTLN